jgi:hypothetical protein
MHRPNRAASTVAAAAIVMAGLSGSACRGEKRTGPAVEVQTQTPVRPTNQPLTVTGCLRAGQADDTFVLTAGETTGAAEAATYQLVGRPDLKLRDYVGHQVEVNGVVKSDQQAAATQPPRPAGTSGSAKVETQTVVDIKSMDVDAVKSVAGNCPK